MKLLTNTEPNKIRIVVAVGQQSFRESLRTMLESDGAFQIVGEAIDAASAVELTSQLKPDIVLLELDLSTQFKVTEPRSASNFFAAVPTLIMFEIPGKAQIVEAFRLGAKGALPKASPPTLWSKSIRRIVAGKYFLASENVGMLVQALQEFLSQKTGLISPNHYGLTQRELQIVERIADGCSNKEVGLEFSIRERTVKRHLTNIFGKVGVSSRLKLAVFARDNHILQDTCRRR